MSHGAGLTLPRPILSSTAAQLFVADIKASCDFYVDKMGFAVDFVYGEPPFYGQVTRDLARLALRVVGEPVFAGDIRDRATALRFAHRRYCRGDRATLFELRGRGSALSSNIEEGALGRQNLHRAGSRWKSYFVC